MEHPNALDQQLENLRTLQQSYDQIAGAAEAYNVGKTQLAQAITSKGVETLPTESYPEMAEKVNAISQETYQINGGEMYAKQLFGVANNDIVPGYWNLYDILAQLLSDGRLVNYGGILLAEYYKGYDSLALSGAGAGGAYVVSDKDGDGNFIMYTEDTTHTWATEFDGKVNRWVAYCFADEYHDFQITDTNTSPRSIFIGRKVGVLSLLVNSRCSQIVVPDGNSLLDIRGNFSQNFNRDIIIRNLKNHSSGILLYGFGSNVENIYIQAEKLSGGQILCAGATANNVRSLVIDCPDTDGCTLINNNSNTYGFTNVNTIILNKASGSVVMGSRYNAIDSLSYFKSIILDNVENLTLTSNTEANYPSTLIVYINYATNEKSKTVRIQGENVLRPWKNVQNVELKNGWCKPLNIGQFIGLTKENVQAHIFDRLGVNDISTGAVTITLASAVLNLFTQEEIDAVVARTNITIVGA